MGRRPCNGIPAFRFTKSEKSRSSLIYSGHYNFSDELFPSFVKIAVMEKMIQENNHAIPDPPALEALARKFSEAEDRKGKVAVQTKQVRNWFQNKRFAIHAKLRSSPSASMICTPEMKIRRPAFRFFTAEIAEMETILQEHNNAVPPFEIIVDLAKKFSESPDRKGQTLVEGKQVWNWFHNRRHSICAKLEKSGDKFDVSPITLDVPSLIRNEPQPSNAHFLAPKPVPKHAPVPECAPVLKYACSSGLEFPSLVSIPLAAHTPAPAPAPALASTSSDKYLPSSISLPVLSPVCEPASSPALASTSSESLLLPPIPAPIPTPKPALVPFPSSVTASVARQIPAIYPASALALRRSLEKICMEFEAKSSRDGAWHNVASFLSHRYSEMGDPEVLVHFAVFGEDDEWVDVCKDVRLRSFNDKLKRISTLQESLGLKV